MNKFTYQWLKGMMMASILTKSYLIYEKSDVAIALEIGTSNFIEEKQQLLNQGFESVGKTVKAKHSYEALNKMKKRRLIESQKPMMWTLLVGSFFS